jgi:hypothetical protein
MTHAETAVRLDDYAGGELDPAEAREVATHLEGCAGCREELEAIRLLLADARELPRGIAPSRDLWAGIAHRIGGSAQPGGGGGEEGGTRVIPLATRRPRVPRWLLSAAAAVVVAVASSAGTAVYMARHTPVPADGPVAGTEVRPATTVPAALAAYAPAEAEYRRAVADLETVLATRRSRLAPETVATLERNLGIIDEAIRQSRAALAADPANAELAGMLSHAYEAKVETLRQVVSL